MAGLGVLLLVGVVLTVRWNGARYLPAGPPADDSLRLVATRYARGVAIALVGGFWAGALVTGPSVRLIMRLLAVTAGDSAQGRLTEAEEVVGQVDLDGTIGLYVFGGLLPALVSGLLYVLVRRWLPAGRWTGATFGVLHLLVAATRIDPLRPDNPDFDLVGPGWLSVTTFGLLAVVHGMTVVAIANRYSAALSPGADRRRLAVPLVVPAAFVVLTIMVPAGLLVGLGVALVVSRVGPVVDALRSHRVTVLGRVAVAGLALALLPGAVTDLRDVVMRDDAAASSAPDLGEWTRLSA